MNSKLVIIHSGIYEHTVRELLLAAPEVPTCFISFNRSYHSIMELYRGNRKDAEKFFFIDLVSPMIFRIKEETNCIFLDPLNLNNLADAILNTIKMNKIQAIIFDSVSSLIVYEEENQVISFVNYVLSFLEELDVDTTLLCLYEDAERPSVKHVKMRVNEVLVKKELGKW